MHWTCLAACRLSACRSTAAACTSWACGAMSPSAKASHSAGLRRAAAKAARGGAPVVRTRSSTPFCRRHGFPALQVGSQTSVLLCCPRARGLLCRLAVLRDIIEPLSPLEQARFQLTAREWALITQSKYCSVGPYASRNQDTRLPPLDVPACTLRARWGLLSAPPPCLSRTLFFL